MILTDEHRAAITKAYKAGLHDDQASLCCAPDARARCAAIVGDEHAEALQTYAYEALSCIKSQSRESTCLTRIANLKELP